MTSTHEDDLSIPDFWALQDYDIFILPSMTVKFYENKQYTSAHEERHLIFLNLLKNKKARVIFVISSPLDVDIINYRMKIFSQSYNDPTAINRLILLSADDCSNRPLTVKILENQKLMDEIRSNIRNPEKAIMLSYICNPLDEELRNKIGIKKWFGSEGTQHWGSKSGSRQIFLESGVPIAEGLNEPIYSADLLYHHAFHLKKSTKANRLILKVDDGSGGWGNVVLDFTGINCDDDDDDASFCLDDVKKVVKKGVLDLKVWVDFGGFEEELKECGCILEEMIDPKNELWVQNTPSVQLYIRGENQVQVLSTHEQAIDGCFYIGCKYPAHADYLSSISHFAKEAGKTLARKGVRGFFGTDFLATKDPKSNKWHIIALEINLRLCATTFAYFNLLTSVDEAQVAKKKYMFLDEVHLKKSYTLPELEKLTEEKGIAYDRQKGRGILFATLSLLTSKQEVSLMCIGDSSDQVQSLYVLFSHHFCLMKQGEITTPPSSTTTPTTTTPTTTTSSSSTSPSTNSAVVVAQFVSA
eukprot:TRINITY_DN1221_c0_g1_i1.p1 TRINITY_DN1221_c0_g1~~TRINITY_DN1221_c0_g1_i1.p1  ORF type:complete len:556 (-),score=156.03 TRINITY_DN1221_c0_g1_i1:55-1635(-)